MWMRILCAFLRRVSSAALHRVSPGVHKANYMFFAHGVDLQAASRMGSKAECDWLYRQNMTRRPLAFLRLQVQLRLRFLPGKRGAHGHGFDLRAVGCMGCTASGH